jgi:hypothetical protein
LGHALLLLLISNPTLHLVVVDNESITPKIIHYFQQHFPDRITFYYGRIETSLAYLPNTYFDLIYMDKEHTYSCLTEYMPVLERVAKQGAFMVLDGYEEVKPLVDTWIAEGRMNKVMVSPCLWTSIVTNLCKK